MNATAERTVDAAGWVLPAAHIPSPNADERPAGVAVDLLVVHAISLPPGEYGSGDVARLFTNSLDYDSHSFYAGLRELRVSAHFLITRNGGLQQFVQTDRRAWHAGVSEFAGRERCNDFSVGIELEGCDDEGFTDRQYELLAVLSRLLMTRYPGITRERITGHSDIAPGRKTDPGPWFDWVRFRASI